MFNTRRHIGIPLSPPYRRNRRLQSCRVGRVYGSTPSCAGHFSRGGTSGLSAWYLSIWYSAMLLSTRFGSLIIWPCTADAEKDWCTPFRLAACRKDASVC